MPRPVNPSKVPHRPRPAAEALAILARQQAGTRVGPTDLLDALQSLGVRTKRGAMAHGCLYQSPDGSWRHLDAVADDVRLATGIVLQVEPAARIELSIGADLACVSVTAHGFRYLAHSDTGDQAAAVIRAVLQLVRDVEASRQDARAAA